MLQWISTDRPTPEIIVKPSDKFADMLIAKLAVGYYGHTLLMLFSKQCI
jgi:hypothetical protein